jgi:hypothetical protein
LSSSSVTSTLRLAQYLKQDTIQHKIRSNLRTRARTASQRAAAEEGEGGGGGVRRRMQVQGTGTAPLGRSPSWAVCCLLFCRPAAATVTRHIPAARSNAAPGRPKTSRTPAQARRRTAACQLHNHSPFSVLIAARLTCALTGASACSWAIAMAEVRGTEGCEAARDKGCTTGARYLQRGRRRE